MRKIGLVGLTLSVCLLSTSVQSVPVSPLDNPVVAASGMFEGRLYALYHADTGFNWFDAAAHCEAEGGYLATITSPAENEFLATLLDNGIAAGFACDRREEFDMWVSTMFGLYEDADGWKWVTGEPFSWSNWGPLAPDNGSGGVPEDFGAMFCPELSPNHRGTWNDIRFVTLFDPPAPVEVPGSRQAFCEFEPSNQPPTADAGADQVVECTGAGGTSVTLNGAASSDPDGGPLTFSWSGPFGTVGGNSGSAIVEVTLDVGVHVVQLTVMDDHGEMATDSVSITVADSTAPDITAALMPLGNNDDDDSSGSRKGKDDDSGKSDDDDSGGNKHRFQVVAQATDTCDPSPAVVAEINGYPVTDGQTVVIKLKNGKERIRVKHGIVEFETSRATLTVVATDAAGNAATEQVVLDKRKDDDDSSDD